MIANGFGRLEFLPGSSALSRSPATLLLIATSLFAGSARGGVPDVVVEDARVCEGNAGFSNLEFRIVASGPPRRLEFPYALRDGTASVADGDYSGKGGVVTLVPRPATLVEHWGAGGFYVPQGVAIAPNGDVLAVDGPGGRVLRFSSDGTLRQAFGPGYGAPFSPVGIAIGRAGLIYVTSSDGRINIYSSIGLFNQSFSSPGMDCYGLATDAAGNVYVSEPRNNRIEKFALWGAHVATWSTGPPDQPQWNGPLGITVDQKGYIYAGMPDGTILKLAPDGTRVATWNDTKGLCRGVGLHVDDAGNLFIADGTADRVVVLDDRGTFLCEWTLDEGPQFRPGSFGATGIATDGNGNVYVGSLYSGGVAHFRWDRSEGSILVPVAGDTRPEPDEYLTLALSSTPQANLVDSTAIGTIVNDDPRPGVDVPPVVGAVADVDASWGRDVVIDVSASDPDGDPIGSLEADLAGLSGASFSVTPDHKHGVLRWRPRFEDVRDEPYPITFTARNAAVAWTTTRIRVGSDLVLNSSFTTGLDGWAGHNGAAVTVVPGGRGDTQAARLSLPGVAWAGITDSPNWVSASGFHRRVVVGAWVRAETYRGAVRMQVREYQGSLLVATSTGETSLTSEWRRMMLVHTCVASGESNLDLTIDAQGGTGDSFDLDDISIVSTGEPSTLAVPRVSKTSLSASVFPNPAHGRTVLEVFLPADDCLRVELYDLAGRRRAVLADGALAHAGSRRFELRDDAGRLSPGIYWYRAWTSSASLQGRVVLLQ